MKLIWNLENQAQPQRTAIIQACHLSSSTSRCTLDKPRLLPPSSAPRPQCPLLHRHIFPSHLPLLLPLFLSDVLHVTRCSSKPACHCLPLDEEDKFCRHGWSHRVLLTTKNSLGPSELKVLKIAQPLSSNASSKIRLKFTSESSGPSKDSSSSNFHFS